MATVLDTILDIYSSGQRALLHRNMTRQCLFNLKDQINRKETSFFIIIYVIIIFGSHLRCYSYFILATFNAIFIFTIILGIYLIGLLQMYVLTSKYSAKISFKAKPMAKQGIMYILLPFWPPS